MSIMNHYPPSEKSLGANLLNTNNMTETQLRQENSELRQRISDLEYKVLTQMEELGAMKDAMNECLRRLNVDVSVNAPSRSLARNNQSFRRSATNNPSQPTMVMSATLAPSSSFTLPPRSTMSNSVAAPSLPSRGGNYSYNTLSTVSRNAASRQSFTSDHGRPRLNGVLQSTPSDAATPITSQPGGPYVIGKKVVPAWKPAGGSGVSGANSIGGTSPTSVLTSPLMASRRRSRSSSALKRTVDQPNGIRDVVFMKSDALVRATINGRPINLYVPSTVSGYDTKDVTELPNQQLRLEWIYGYRGRDCRNNIHYLPTGEMAYFIATVVVLYNEEENIQRHYTGHTEDVRCITVHPDRITVATGQASGRTRSERKAHVRIWNSVNLNTLHVIGLENFQLAVSCIAFSKADGGELLAVIDDSQEHSISLWDWQKEVKVTETGCSSEPVIAMEFHPLDRGQLITCGKNHLAFWTLDACQLFKKQANFEKYDRPKAVLSIIYVESGDLVSGDSSGNLCIWRRGSYKLCQVIQKAHEGPIAALCLTREGNLVSGGGRDGRIIGWDSAFQPTGLELILREMDGAVRSLTSQTQAGNMLLIGTSKNHILQWNPQMGLRPAVSSGHWDEMWCLATPLANQASSGKSPYFFSGSYDGHVTLWDSLTHEPVWSRELSPDSPPHCATFHPSGQMITVGTRTGRWIVMDLNTQELIAVHTDGTEQIECIQYSLDGSQVAIASRDTSIYIYNCLEGGRKYSRVGKCTGHMNSVTHLDWSENGRYIRSSSLDNELLYWTSNNCRQVVACSQLRDTEWISHNCVLGYHVMGLWTSPSENSTISQNTEERRHIHRVPEMHINACARSNSSTLLVSAEGDMIKGGALKFMRYPASHPKTHSYVYKSHSGEVTNVAFLSDDSRVISLGGRDCSIMQWEVVPC